MYNKKLCESSKQVMNLQKFSVNTKDYGKKNLDLK